MAVLVTINIPNVTTDQYDEVFKQTNPDGMTAEGGSFHAVAKTEGGLFMCDIWDSEEAFQNFMATKIGPAMATSGATQMPEIAIMPIYHVVQDER
jgi:heme-degrading monooxygenase HmoA